MVKVSLSSENLELIREALDSHIYWQLSDEHYRSDGYVQSPGSDNPDNVEIIGEAEALLRLLQIAHQSPTSEEPESEM